MSEESAALCQRCGRSTGKIYEPYLCAECKVVELEERLSKAEFIEEDVDKYKRMYREEAEKSAEYFAYKQAFRVMLKELTK